MQECMQKQLELAEYQLWIQAKLGLETSDAYKAWREYRMGGEARQQAEADTTEKPNGSKEERPSTAEETD